MGSSIYLGKVLSAGTKGCNIILPTVASYDPDAQAFITAASITDPTQQSAINQLVVDLKGYNIWTKMKAIYPFCGSTASQHKWNLKDPRDLDTAFRLVFNGGWTHSANGALPNGTNAFASTVFNPTTQALSTSSQHLSYYSRTNVSEAAVEIGVIETANNNFLSLYNSGTSGTRSSLASSTRYNQAMSPVDTRGLFVSTRVDASNLSVYRNGSLQATQAIASTGNDNYSIFLGAYGSNTPALYSTKQCAFASIGDGLTSTEAANFYTAVQAYQTTLGRSIGTQTVSDADAQAFVTNAGIVDQVEANAVNNLVIGLKADGLWSKMSAIYPMVGGTSTTTSYNLRNTAQYQITWGGGLTHSSTGVLPNGTNGFGNTNFSFNGTTALSSHISTYIRTNSTTLACEFGSGNSSGAEECFIVRNGSTYLNNQCDAQTGRLNPSVADARGLILNSRTANNSWKTYRNGSSLATGTLTNSYTGGSSYNLNLFRRGGVGTNDLYSAKECAFASIGDGLNDTDVTNLNTRVTTFQTALNRNV